MTPIVEFWRSRSRREQLLLACLGFVLLGAFWLLGVLSLQERTDRYRALADTELALLDQVIRLSARMETLPTPRPRSDTSLLLVANRSLRDAGLEAHLVEGSAEGDRRVRLQLRDAPFPGVSAWLAGLAVQEGIRTVSADIEAGDAEGVVKLGLVLEREE